MNVQQVKTLKRLTIAGALLVALVLWLLVTEGLAVAQGGNSTISEIFWLAWAHQPGAVALVAIVVVFIVGVLWGHFTWQHSGKYDDIRKRGLLIAALAALPFLLGADRCSISWPQPGPSPTASPTSPPPPGGGPTPEPTATPTPSPTPTGPPGASCAIDGEPGAAIPGYKQQLGPQVFAAIKAVRPDCETGGVCLLGDMTRRQWHTLVIASLQKGGLCAGEHEPGVTDEIAVATSATAPREGWHIFAGDDSDGPVPPGRPRRTVAWKGTGAYAAPTGPGPTPTPTTAPTTAPTPAGDGCWEPAPPPAYGIKVKVHTAFCANLDSTIQVKDAAYCARIGFTDGRSICPVRMESAADRAACEARLRGPRQTWSCDGAGCQVFPCDVAGNCSCGDQVNTNPAQAIVVGHGKVTTCTFDGKACGSVVVP